MGVKKVQKREWRVGAKRNELLDLLEKLRQQFPQKKVNDATKFFPAELREENLLDYTKHRETLPLQYNNGFISKPVTRFLCISTEKTWVDKYLPKRGDGIP